MIYTLTMNPSIDIFTRPDSLSAAAVRIGGKGINVSRFLSVLGHKSRCLFPCGGGAGRLIRESLCEESLDPVPFCGGSVKNRFNIKFTGSRESEQNGRGSVGSDTCCEILDFLSGTLRPGDILTLCGSLPDGTDPGFYAEALNIASGKGASVIVDASGGALVKAISAKPYLAKPNLSEASALPGFKPGMNAKEAAQLVAASGARRALVSDGANGAAYYESGTGNPITVPASPVRVVSTVGAGDALTAAFIDGAARGLSGEALIKRCVSFAEMVISTPFPYGDPCCQ